MYYQVSATGEKGMGREGRWRDSLAVVGCLWSAVVVPMANKDKTEVGNNLILCGFANPKSFFVCVCVSSRRGQTW